jgi:hypothetical protein
VFLGARITGRIFGFAWWDFAGVPDDVTYFIRNVNPVFVMMDWARGTDKSPKSANPLQFIHPFAFFDGTDSAFSASREIRPVNQTYFHIARINN